MKKRNSTSIYGKSITYNAVHLWLKFYYGNGIKCERCGVLGKKNGRKWSIEWALKPGLQYKKIREHFEALCMSCHRKQDIDEKILNNMRKGWIKRKKVHGLVPINKHGRFIKTNPSG